MPWKRAAKDVRARWLPLPDTKKVVYCVFLNVSAEIGPGPTEMERMFSQLLMEWKRDNKYVSSTSKMVLHPAYQQIIGMGSQVIPLLLRELRERPDHWFWALKAIAGTDPVPECDRGKVRAMAVAWLKWGKEQGYIE